jgi:5-(aminomethyl)-3-furanmethanol phosphate kinase
MRTGQLMWVIKLGGSLATSAELRSWLAAIVHTHGPPRVLVPGGGPFADAVRVAQEHWRFDDRIADRMALLAMHQYGLMLTGLEPKLREAETIEAIRAACVAGHVPVWLPYAMVAEREDVEASWEMTSDSLALWLASTLEAERLVLVKSAALPHELARIGSLMEKGILDRAFARYARAFAGEIFCIQRGEHAALADALARGEPTGTRVLRR